jgi:hypothetical protein
MTQGLEPTEPDTDGSPRAASRRRAKHRVGPRHLLFPFVVAAMTVYALASPSLDLVGALGLPEAANPGLRPAAAILLF